MMLAPVASPVKILQIAFSIIMLFNNDAGSCSQSCKDFTDCF